jgi:hypothetical protein
MDAEKEAESAEESEEESEEERECSEDKEAREDATECVSLPAERQVFSLLCSAAPACMYAVLT